MKKPETEIKNLEKEINQIKELTVDSHLVVKIATIKNIINYTKHLKETLDKKNKTLENYGIQYKEE